MSTTAKRKGTNMALVISVLLMSFVGRTNTFVAPALAAIGKNFPDVSMANIQLIMTMGMIGNFPMTMITGAIADKFRPKPLVVLGCFLISLGALFPIVLHGSIWMLYISNFIMGVGQGLTLTINSILIAQLFEEPERSRMFGLRGSAQQIGSMAMAMAAGWFATLGWYNVYWTGVVTLVSLIGVIILLPNVEKAEKKMEAAAVEKRKGIPAETWIIAGFIFLFGIPFAVNIVNASMLLDSQLGLGSEVAGTTQAVTGVVSIVSGILYKNFSKILKQNTLWVGTALLTVGLALQYLCTNYAMFLIGACCITMGFLFAFTGGMHAIPRMVAANQVSFGIGFFMAIQSLGSMITPYVVNPIARAITGVESANGNYLVAMVWAAAVIVIAVIWGITHKKYYIDEVPAQL